MSKISDGLKSISEKLDTEKLLARALHEWQPVLANDINVFSCEHGFLAKRFNEINFQFCAEKEAQQIVKDNLFAILRYKYFTVRSDDIDERIDRIIGSFCRNLATTLPRITFDENIAKSEGLKYAQYLPDGCVAFSNGVYDFRKNEWFFTYDTTYIKQVSNIMYTYDTTYIIQWYLNYHFEPLPIDVLNDDVDNLIECLKIINEDNRIFAFELIYNMSHNNIDEFDRQKFVHLCEILGYTCLQNFAQYFVLFIGAGQNGKNSLFDGCFTNRLVPRPASIDFDTIEKDRFVTGSLANKSHNIFLETSAKKYTESKVIKALTGSMYQSIENKNEPRYSGIINCKYIFAGNDKDNIKFSDTTMGFLRRINMIDIFYTWDHNKDFLRKGDYYDTSFSDSLKELKDDVTNTTIFVYLAMYGIAHATASFTQYFRFTVNDWDYSYTDVNLDVQTQLSAIKIDELMTFVAKSDENKKLFESSFFTTSPRARICASPEAKMLGLTSADAFIVNNTAIDDGEIQDSGNTKDFFLNNQLFVSIRFLQLYLGNTETPMLFTQIVKKAFGISSIPFTYGNKPFVRVMTYNGRELRVVR